MTEKQCKDCKHASFMAGGMHGQCSRFPPSAIVVYNDDNGFDIRYAFPPVLEVTQACGEFAETGDSTTTGINHG